MAGLKSMFVAMIALTLSGCTFYSGLKPVYPDVGHPNYHVVKVSSLQPTLKWEASSEPDATYDLNIFEGPETGSDLLPMPGWKRDPVKLIYSREGLQKPEHAVEEPLKPGYAYFWSVRTHEKEKISKWSRYSYCLFGGFFYYWAPNQYFRFRTPRTPQ
jgi:hypothetical protein